jgi:nitrogen regulatory protein P-II 1
MKKITVYFKPFKLEAILSRLPQDGIFDVQITEVRGYGRQKGQLELYKGAEYGLMFLPKARLEIYCEDETVAAVEQAIMEGAKTGRIGDGKITIVPLEQNVDF